MFEGVAVATLWGPDKAGLGRVEWARLGDWLDTTAPDEAVLVAVRAVAFALAAWLLLGTLAYLLARLANVPRLLAGTRWVTLAGVRRLVDAAVAVSVVGGAFAGPRPAFAQSPAPVVIDLSTTAPHLYTPVPAGDGPPTTIPASTTTSVAGAVATQPAAPDTSPVVSPSTTVPSTWTVAHGDCFWTIADDVLTRAWGRPPTDAEIVPYWVVLIDANRPLLVEPGNPHLILPGQLFTVPPAPAVGASGR